MENGKQSFNLYRLYKKYVDCVLYTASVEATPPLREYTFTSFCRGSYQAVQYLVANFITDFYCEVLLVSSVFVHFMLCNLTFVFIRSNSN